MRNQSYSPRKSIPQRKVCSSGPYYAQQVNGDSKLANSEEMHPEEVNPEEMHPEEVNPEEVHLKVALKQWRLAPVRHQLELMMRMRRMWRKEELILKPMWKTRKKMQPWTEQQMPPVAF